MKTTFGCVALAVLVVVGSGVVRASEDLKAIVASYLEIHEQLANDKIDGVKGPARAIAERAASMGKRGEPIAKAASALAGAGDVKGAREAFGALSDAVIAAGNAEQWKDTSPVKLAYCPMVNRSWLQKDDKIRNPYYGSQMATCGEFKPLGK